MAATQLVVVCVPAGDGVAVAPCGTFNGQPLAPSVVQIPTLTQETVTAIEAAARPVDYVQSGQYFGAAFGIVFVLFLVGFSVGSILNVFERG